MKKSHIFFSVLMLVVFVLSCKFDDTSPNPQLKLPYDNLDEFFAQQRLQADTFVINASADETILTANGAKLEIEAETFIKNNMPVDGNVSVVIRELLRKSEMVLLDRPSTASNTILEYGGIIVFNAFKDNEALALQKPVSATLPASEQLSSFGGMSHYSRSGTWMLVNNSDVVVDINEETLQFETENQGWMCAAMETNFNDLTTVQARPFGYGTILTDIAGFIVLSDFNTVVRMEGDMNGLKVSRANIPKGVQASIVIFAMDDFRLFAGIKNIEIGDNHSEDIRVNDVTDANLSVLLQELD